VSDRRKSHRAQRAAIVVPTNLPDSCCDDRMLEGRGGTDALNSHGPARADSRGDAAEVLQPL